MNSPSCASLTVSAEGYAPFAAVVELEEGANAVGTFQLQRPGGDDGAASDCGDAGEISLHEGLESVFYARIRFRQCLEVAQTFDLVFEHVVIVRVGSITRFDDR